MTLHSMFKVKVKELELELKSGMFRFAAVHVTYVEFYLSNNVYDFNTISINPFLTCVGRGF